MLRNRGLLTRLMIPSRKSPQYTKSQSFDLTSPSAYTTPSPLVPLEGISDTAEPLVIGNSFRLLERVKSLGVSNMITTCASELPALGAGLNSILLAKPAKPMTTNVSMYRTASRQKQLLSATTSAIESGIGSRYELVPTGPPKMMDYAMLHNIQRTDVLRSPRKQINHSNVNTQRTRSASRHLFGTSASSGTTSDSLNTTIRSPNPVEYTATCSTPMNSNSALTENNMSESSIESCDTPTPHRRAKRPTFLRLPLTVETQLYSKSNCMDVFDTSKSSSRDMSDLQELPSDMSTEYSQGGSSHVPKLNAGGNPPSSGIVVHVSQSLSPNRVIASAGATKKFSTTSGSSLAKLL